METLKMMLKVEDVRAGDFVKQGVGDNERWSEVTDSHVYLGSHEDGFTWTFVTAKSQDEWDYENYPTYGIQPSDDYDDPSPRWPYDCTNEYHTHQPEEEIEVIIPNGGQMYVGYDKMGKRILKPIRWWVAVYEVDRGYGGPEEGGWYFDTGVLQLSVPCDSREQAEVIREIIAPDWESTSDSSSVIYSGGDYRISVRKHKPADEFPERTPHYS